jgi:large subunit ribosomal protein L18
VRKSIKNTRVQFVEYNADGDRILVSAVSDELVEKYKWKYATSTTPAAYLTGLLAGKRAKEQGITEGILDIGRYVPTGGSKLFAALKGTLDAGIQCPHDSAMLPNEQRLMGKHLSKEIMPAVHEIKSKIIGDK